MPPGSQVGSREMIDWLHKAMDVLQAAADSADFFDRAARAVVDTVGLDSARVLLLINGEWQIKTTQISGPSDSPPPRPPSQTVLQTIRQKKRTLWEQPGNDSEPTESLYGIHTVVAAPILDKCGEAIGALYGERRCSPKVRCGFSELEAMLVELLARGVAAGLARLEEERKGARHRAQFEQFFTPELARQLMNQPDLLEGKDRDVTVLFCDIRSFSRISSELGAELTIKWCRDVLDMLSEAVFNQDGVVVDYVGDGLMAMWGRRETNRTMPPVPAERRTPSSPVCQP